MCSGTLVSGKRNSNDILKTKKLSLIRQLFFANYFEIKVLSQAIASSLVGNDFVSTLGLLCLM